jgi:protein-tyrosine phosphatase
VERHIDLDGLCNLRDLGGYAALDGRTVRWRRLYRSDSLSRLTDPVGFAALGVRTVVDLRYPAEIAASGRVPDSARYAYHNLSIEHRPYDQWALGPDVGVTEYLAERYAEVALDGVREIGQALRVIAAADSAPVVVHCTSGKDRTGIVAALVLALLGVSDDDIVADFALTARATDRLAERWRTDHPDRTLRWPGYGQAPPELMRTFLGHLRDRHGSPLDYAVSELRLDSAVIDSLRAHLLGPQPSS